LDCLITLKNQDHQSGHSTRMASSRTTEPWSELFVNITIPRVTEIILDYLMDPTVLPGELHDLMPLRLVNKSLRDIIDNYEPVWHCFDDEQPLLMPTLFGHVHNIERLLAKGADVNKPGEESRWEVDWARPPTPLQLAARYGVLSSAKMLVENGADMTPGKKYEQQKENYNTHDSSDEEEIEDEELRKILDNDFHETLNDPLQLAAEHGHIPLIEFFLENGVDINAKDARGHTPLFAACEGALKESAMWLIERGADVFASAESNDAEWTDCMTMAFDMVGWKDVYKAMRQAGARAAKKPRKE